MNEYINDYKKNLKKIKDAISKLPDNHALDIVMIESHKMRGNAKVIKHDSAASLTNMIEISSFKIKNGKEKINDEIIEFFSDVVKALEESLKNFEENKEYILQNKERLKRLCKKYCPSAKDAQELLQF